MQATTDVDFLMKIIRPVRFFTPDRGLSSAFPTQTGGSATAVRKRVRGGLDWPRDVQIPCTEM